MDYWENGVSSGGSMHKTIAKLKSESFGMEALRVMFPEGDANIWNFVIFSTSGTHGFYTELETVEKRLGAPDNKLTFLVVCPRVVHMRYGNVVPESQEDIDFLKRLRETSKEAVLEYFSVNEEAQ